MKNTLKLLIVIASLTYQMPSFGLVVHEWGTFTSVQGSDGKVLSGLEHEEEELPSFIHNINSTLESTKSTEAFSVGQGPSGCRSFKGICPDLLQNTNGLPALITQKMETPVLYFYSDKAMKVDVTVDFPKGLITQYYPAPTAVYPTSPGERVMANGKLVYKGLEILTEKADVPPVLKGNVYGPARETKANFVRSGNENEKFIFYRGLGNFSTSLTVTSNQNLISFQNRMMTSIPYMIALNIQNGKASFKELGALQGSLTMSQDLAEFSKAMQPNLSMSEFETQAGGALVKALEASGLYRDEALSMVNTWKTSYFRTEGLRVLYVLPRSETDALLPIQISPKPSELVRTLVGRIEIMTTNEEKQLMSSALEMKLPGLGRFKEPKLLRIRNLTQDSNTRAFLQAQMSR